MNNNANKSKTKATNKATNTKKQNHNQMKVDRT